MSSDCKPRLRPQVLGLWLSVLITFTASAGLSAPATDRGEEVYKQKCATCHGPTGKGDGLAASGLRVRPRNFTTARFKIRSTETGSIPTDEDLLRVVKSGLHGTSMPDWGTILSAEDTTAAIGFVKSFSPRFRSEIPKPVAIVPPAASTPESVSRGRAAYSRMQCSKCHGESGDGQGAVSQDLKDEWGYETHATNLTEPWAFRGGSAADDIYMRLVTGMDGTPMPSFAEAARGEDLRDLADYVATLGRRPAWSMDAAQLRDFYSRLDKQAAADPVKRGRYIVETHGCADCHTAVRDDMTPIEELRLAGGMRWSFGPYGDYFTRNLTSDKETGLGDWKDDEIIRAFTQGIGRDERRFLPVIMPWTSFSNFNAEDRRALVAYLRSLPPVYNKIPLPKPLNTVSYLVGKFKMLILDDDPPVLVYPGNAGESKTPVASRASVSHFQKGGR